MAWVADADYFNLHVSGDVIVPIVWRGYLRCAL